MSVYEGPAWPVEQYSKSTISRVNGCLPGKIIGCLGSIGSSAFSSLPSTRSNESGPTQDLKLRRVFNSFTRRVLSGVATPLLKRFSTASKSLDEP